MLNIVLNICLIFTKLSAAGAKSATRGAGNISSAMCAQLILYSNAAINVNALLYLHEVGT